MKKANSTSVAALAAALSFSVMSAGAAQAELAGTITFDAPLSLTGVAAFAGLSEQQGMDMAIEEINSTGYLGDAKLAANYVDVATSTDQAVAAARGSASSDVPAIVGFTIGNHALAVAPLAQRAGLPMIVANSGGLTALTQVGEYIYQTDVGQHLYAHKLAEVLAERGVKSTAILYHNDVPAVLDLHAAYLDVFPTLGITVTQDVGTISTTQDFTAMVTTLLAGEPDAIGVLTRGGSPGIIGQLRQLGYEGVLWGQAGLAGGVAVKAAPATEGVLFTANAARGSSFPTMEEFFHKAAGQTDGEVYAFAAQGYDAVWALARALKTADCGTRDCVQQGMQKLMETGYSGALGDVTFENRNAKGPGVVIEIKDGKEEFVK